jgi:hypothetical protein
VLGLVLAVLLVTTLSVLSGCIAPKKDVTASSDASDSEEDAAGWRGTEVVETPTPGLPPQTEVTVITDRNEYEQGEEISARLRWDGAIYAWGEYAWSIQRRDNGSWSTILRRGDPYLSCSNIAECTDVDLSTTEECPSLVLCEEACWYEVQAVPLLAWDQTIKVDEERFECEFVQRLPDGRVTSEEVVARACAVFEQAPPGLYRIRFEYALAPDPGHRCSRETDITYAERQIAIQQD